MHTAIYILLKLDLIEDIKDKHHSSDYVKHRLLNTPIKHEIN